MNALDGFYRARVTTFWAKTDEQQQPGISVRDHCLNVGFVAEALIAAMPDRVRELLPGEHGQGASLLAALHDIGKITIGFQAKCAAWLTSVDPLPCAKGEVALSVTDHAFVSQAFLQRLPAQEFSPDWAIAVGAHHGRPKGRLTKFTRAAGHLEAASAWAEPHRAQLLAELQSRFGPLPTTPPDARFGVHLSDVWLLAGLITMADWIGSNESWFSSTVGIAPDAASQQTRDALRQIGWPGGALRQTTFADAFATSQSAAYEPNAIQTAVADACGSPGIVVVEGPMGCGKTEAALWAAQRLIAAGRQHGIYFALPSQVTSNRIHQRIESFLRNSLSDPATLRLAHGNAWLEDDFDLHIVPSYVARGADDIAETEGYVREARSWFAGGKRALLAPYGVGTVDQALQAVVAVKHFFVRRFALAGKVVILDEVHSYDVYTGTLITALIRELISLRCSVIILSATLTTTRRRELLAAAGVQDADDSSAYPLVSGGTPGSVAWPSVAPSWPEQLPVALRVDVIDETTVLDELLSRAEAGQHVLWMRNTVAEAQESFRAVISTVREGTVQCGLLHSRFPFRRRAELEDYWLERLGRARGSDGPGSILIATQVVEQSVDIDLDFIVSDLAPTDMLLQRVGRLWRHPRADRRAKTPEFWVRLPDVSRAVGAAELRQALGRSGRVYAPYVLLRTADVWRERSVLRLPADIRPMLEATYADADSHEDVAWRELHATLEAEKAELSANADAATRVLGQPMLDDAADILTRRKGPPTTPVFLLRAVTPTAGGRILATAMDGEQADINGRDWQSSSAKFLHPWLVRVPMWMVPPHPPRPRWLALHGPDFATVATVGADGYCQFDGEDSDMTYDWHAGVSAERRRPSFPLEKDDDGEFDS